MFTVAVESIEMCCISMCSLDVSDVGTDVCAATIGEDGPD